ncbi:hypothetical protein JB92DRAFT_2835036 [Gautieria morchelliformis]|nr:hypothetical protein JB92DRAFT_2835036 [Gautieria morchelliformis]
MSKLYSSLNNTNQGETLAQPSPNPPSTTTAPPYIILDHTFDPHKYRGPYILRLCSFTGEGKPVAAVDTQHQVRVILGRAEMFRQRRVRFNRVSPLKSPNIPPFPESVPIHVPATLSRLEACPVEVLEAIVLAIVGRNLPGPPADLASLLRVSKVIYGSISTRNNPSLYGKIFARKFDDRAPVRRLGQRCKRGMIRTEELVKQFQSLKRFKMMECRQFCAAPTARGDLWVAYLLFLEHDRHNYQQLVSYAAVDKFASSFIKDGGPFHDGAEGNGGWRIDSEINALAAWIFWFTDKGKINHFLYSWSLPDRVASETQADRARVLAAFSHMFVGSFKYASTHAPITSFHVPPPSRPLLPPPTPALPLAALPSSRQTYLQHYFGLTVAITHPLLTPAALLSCVVRLEAAGAEMAILLSPTDDELAERTRPTTGFADWVPGCGSEQYEHDWIRLLTCYIPSPQPMIRPRAFTPGMLNGTWVGRCFIPLEQFDYLLAPHPLLGAASSPLLHVYPRPMQFHIREYHAHDPSQLLGHNDSSQDFRSEGVFKAWLPQGVAMTETERELWFSFDTPGTMRPSKYDIYDPVTAARRRWDIILTARTGDDFGSVWGHKPYYGRVRDWDGLILLFSIATPGEPSLIFSGYIHGNTNLVGRWRETATPVDLPGWEGVWSVTKIE